MFRAKQPKTNTIHQSQNDMAWLVRHCSPSLYLQSAAHASWSGHQSDSARQRHWRTIVDFCGFRIQVRNR